jgi:large subunit ribosomal protein L24
VTLGGADLQSLRGDISSAAGGWTLDRFEFRAPGLSEIRLSGHLGFEQSGTVFTGPAEIAANDPGALAAWLEGRKDAGQGAPRPLRLRGDLTLGSEKIAIERLSANFNRGAVSGRFIYAFGKNGARVDASLNAPELDLDAASSFARAVIAGSSLERPKQGTLALDLGRARYAGIETGKTSARLTYDRGAVTIEQLAIENFGGANLAASGQVAFAPAPRGSIAVDLDARELTGITAILARYAPQMAERLNVVAPALAPARLHATVKLDNDASGSRGNLSVAGTAGVTRISFNGESALGLSALTLDNARLQGQVDASDSNALARLVGLDRVVTVKKEPGTFRVTLSGNPFGDLALTTWLSAGAAEASATGTVHLAPGAWPKGSVYVNVARADLAPLRGNSLPVAFTARVTSDGKQVVADEISAVLAGSKLRGKVTASLGWPSRVDGALDADTIDIPSLIAAASGASGGDAWNWPAAPFGSGAFEAVRGQISLSATRANLTPNLNARQFRGRLILGDGEASLEDVSGALAGGEINGNLTLKSGASGLNARTRITLANADIAALLPFAARPPLAGRLSLQLDVAGSGRSPATLVGSLQGSGKVTLAEARFAGLDPRAFAAVTRAVDQGLPPDNAKIEGVVARALDSGQFSARQVEGDLAVNAGQLRLNNTRITGEGADLALSGSVDLTSGTLDVRLVLTGAGAAAGTRPDIFVALHGPVSAPGKTLDVSGLTGWLTLRAIDLQSKKLDAIEAAPKAETKVEPPAPPAVPHAEIPADTRPKEPAPPKKPTTGSVRKPEHAPVLPAPINILPLNVAPTTR